MLLISSELPSAERWSYKFSAYQRRPYSGPARYFGPLQLVRFMNRPTLIGNSMKIQKDLANFGFKWDGHIQIDGTPVNAPNGVINGALIGTRELNSQEIAMLGSMGVDISSQSTEFLPFQSQAPASPVLPTTDAPPVAQSPVQQGAQSNVANVDMIMKLRQAASAADTAKVMQEQIQKLIGLMTNPNLTDEQQKLKQQFLQFMASAHSYSFFNTILIFMQRTSASMVGGQKNLWGNKGRAVNPGESPIWILAPVFKPRHTSEEEKRNLIGRLKSKGLGDKEVFQKVEEYKKNNRVLVGFKDVPVYDIGQTSPIPNWRDPVTGEPPYDPSAFHKSYLNKMNDPDEYADALFLATKRAAEKMGIAVGQKSTGFAGGYSSGNNIVLDEGSQGQRRVATMFHEFAHEILHQGAENKSRIRQEQISRKVKELEAESTAFLLTQAFEIQGDPEWAARYIVLWEASPKDVMDRQQEIHKAYSKIFKAVKEELDVMISENENKAASAFRWTHRYGRNTCLGSRI